MSFLGDSITTTQEKCVLRRVPSGAQATCDFLTGTGAKEGRPRKRIPCDVCGKYVQDRREVVTERKVMCGACADGRYYMVK